MSGARAGSVTVPNAVLLAGEDSRLGQTADSPVQRYPGLGDTRDRQGSHLGLVAVDDETDARHGKRLPAGVSLSGAMQISGVYHQPRTGRVPV